MTMGKKIVLGTSIAPVNIEQQILTVQSWIKNGFKVISCNSNEEIDLIKPFFSKIEIEFVEVQCGFDLMRSKKLPFIYDILFNVWKRTECIGGFINSDIYIDNMSEELYDFIIKETLDGFLLVRRNDVEKLEDIKTLNWKMHFDGIDMFLIDKKFIPNFFNAGFFVQSCWDACILLEAKMQKIKIKELMNPIAFHKRHCQQWNFKMSKLLIEDFYYKYFHTKENAYEKVIQFLYDILLNECIQVCYLKNQNVKCLFVVKREDFSIEGYIKNQDFPKSNIAIENNDDNRREYDYIFYIPEETIITNVFCKNVIFIMTCCEYSKVELGKFYVTKIGKEYHYSSMDKNMDLLEYIQEKNPSNVIVYAQNKKVNLCKKIVRPIVYEEINILDKNTFYKFKPQGTYYIVPAGIRANQWFQENAYKLKNMEFLGFLDNKKRGIGEFGKIFPLDVLYENQEAYVFVASKYYLKEIMEQVNILKKSNKIINTGLVCYIDQDGTVYYFDIERKFGGSRLN